uniref:Glycoprotein vOX2-4 n=1 Tax=Elephant endotheliotropic herpesvirus 1A TaxID=759753 RepID=A0A386AUI4_ELHV1|nr:glycoprotein vOX2-4 [Elephant endotheliotropic herpesvirus 1A]AYC62820.1 glycoprotein vOX2-4 [Elephant endotheliotropic herpesvirus 1A]
MFLGPYVETKNHQLGLLNTNVTLNCALKNSYDSIFIIAWHKNGTNGRTNVGTTGKQFHEKEVQVTTVTHDDNMKSSGLNILNTTKNDSCCFICSFHCSNKGPSNCSVFSNTTCLTIYASVETNISSSSNKLGEVNVTCLARAVPPASNVTWIGASTIDNSTSVTDNKDGTLTVKSTLYVSDPDHQINGTVYCRVAHGVSVTYLAGPWNSTDDLGIFHLILKELNLTSDEFGLYFNDDGDDDGEDEDDGDDDGEDDDYEDYKK